MRLIDADALLYDIDIVPLTEDGGVDINDLEEIIKRQPTIEERKTGRWIPHDCLGRPSIDKDVCSECKQRFYQIAETGCEWNYCPNCGAKMEVEHEAN